MLRRHRQRPEAAATRPICCTARRCWPCCSRTRGHGRRSRSGCEAWTYACIDFWRALLVQYFSVTDLLITLWCAPSSNWRTLCLASTPSGLAIRNTITKRNLIINNKFRNPVRVLKDRQVNQPKNQDHWFCWNLQSPLVFLRTWNRSP